MNDLMIVKAIEANVVGAQGFINFWVMRDVLPDGFSAPYLIWEHKTEPEPAPQQIQAWVGSLPPQIPQSVTRRQGRLALLEAGKLSAVEAAIAAIEDPIERRAAEIEYEADTWDRDNEFLQQLWTELGGTETELDELFILAAGL